MPSASAKIEKVASPEATDPVKAIGNMLEKRIRNLEKRKVKLENYRTDVSNGKELNEDQRIAVSKYDQVEGVLEFTREFTKAISSVVLESARQQKKMAKKEQMERQQHEIQRLQEAFIFRHILSCFNEESVRNDFLNGENGAVKITSDELTQLDQLNKLLWPGLPNEQADIANHFRVLSENFIFLVEGKNKEVSGTSYRVLRELLRGIKDSGYFSRPSATQEEEVASSDDAPEEDVIEKSEPLEEVETSDEITENAVSLDNDQSEVEAVEEITPTVLSPVPVETEPATAVNLQNGPLQDVLSSQGSFNFLQESQIDLDAPHMDPAVVAVHQIAPPPAANFPVSSYPVSPPTGEEKPTVNGIEPINNSAMQPSRTAVPLSSVQSSALDFDPSHPIPTQTFTNQSFAVMQNMMLPQAYVPVTMHHGPIPPHMAPIAVVPGLSSPVTSTAPVMPIHMSVAPVMLGPAAVKDAVAPETIASEPVEGGELQHADTESENVSSATQPSNVSTERTGNNEGYQHTFRGGFRGRGQRRGSGYFRRPYNNNRGGFQNHYYQDRNGYNSNFRRGNGRGGPRGNGNNRGRNGNYRTQTTEQQPQQQQQQQPPQQQPQQQQQQ